MQWVPPLSFPLRTQHLCEGNGISVLTRLLSFLALLKIVLKYTEETGQHPYSQVLLGRPVSEGGVGVP